LTGAIPSPAIYVQREVVIVARLRRRSKKPNGVRSRGEEEFAELFSVVE
jgi:hypothetical protein